MLIVIFMISVIVIVIVIIITGQTSGAPLHDVVLHVAGLGRAAE